MDPQQQQQNKREHEYSNDNMKDENSSGVTPILVFTSDCSSSSSSGCSDSGCCEQPKSDYQGLGSTDVEHVALGDVVDTSEKQHKQTSFKKIRKTNRPGVRFAPTFDDDDEQLNNVDNHIHIDESGGNYHSMWQTERAPALPSPSSSNSYPSSLSPTSPSFPSSLSSVNQSNMSTGSISAPSTPSTPSFSITQAPAPYNNSSGRRRLSSTGPCSNSVPCRQSSLKWKQRNGSATFELNLSQGEFMRCGGARYDDIA